jgi:hypothetical protein
MIEFLAIFVGLVVLAVLFKPFFGDLKGFWDCLLYWLTPDIFSMLRGRWGEDIFSELKLFIWLACGGGAGYFVYKWLV